MDNVGPLIERWRMEAARLSAYAPGAAAAFERCADDLAATIDAEGDRVVTLKRAAEMTGYSYSQLYRMVRSGRLESIGQSQVIVVRVADLPKKPGRIDDE